MAGSINAANRIVPKRQPRAGKRRLELSYNNQMTAAKANKRKINHPPKPFSPLKNQRKKAFVAFIKNLLSSTYGLMISTQELFSSLQLSSTISGIFKNIPTGTVFSSSITDSGPVQVFNSRSQTEKL